MDIITLALAKKFATAISAGYSKVEVNDTTIIFTLNDGTTTSLTVPTPADGISVTNLDIDENGNLLCYLSNGEVINAGLVPSTGIDLSDYAKKEYVDEKIGEIGVLIDELNGEVI